MVDDVIRPEPVTVAITNADQTLTGTAEDRHGDDRSVGPGLYDPSTNRVTRS